MNTDALTAGLFGIVGGVIGLAIISVLVSKNAQTPTVLGAAGSALSGVIGAAVSPVTGATASGTTTGFNIGSLANTFGSQSFNQIIGAPAGN